MEEMLKRDANLILEKFNKEKDESKKRQYAYEYMGIIDVLSRFSINNIDIPNDIYKSYIYIKNMVDLEKIDLNKQFYNNLSKLEEIYNSFLNVFTYIDYSKVNITDEEIKFDINILKEFFKYYNIDNELLNNNNIFYFDKFIIDCSINLKSINKQYMFLQKDNSFSGMKMFAHEMGHIHDFNISKDTEVQYNYILLEFMSIMFENLLINYLKNINNNIAHNENIRNLMNIFMIISQAHNQTFLMQNFDDAFIDMEINPIYKEYFENLNRRFINNQTNSLKLQYYAIGSLLSLTFIKNNYNLEDINNFYKNNINNNLNNILKFISISDINEYVLESFNKDKIKKL